ncbi:putative E3 ubiquitin-protein ligase TRIML1 [Macrotis lagotis]|uniref:putative E3 ubiquitin-protein ligase TRIML1 n=1 Tax=Macrotis lagotis TaxID=92651 RepID=UPI003D688F4F
MAAAREILQEMQKEITCGICQSYFSQPVTMGCGHSFCQACLSQSWRVEATAFSCPQCRQVAQVREFTTVNECLAQLADLGKQLSCQLLQSTEGQHQCATHKEVLKFFCEEDQTLLCVRCQQTPEHEAHQLSPIDQVAPSYKEKFQHIQSHLEKLLDEAEKLLAEENPGVDWESMIQGEYLTLHNFLLEEESRCLDRMNQERRASQDRLSRQMQSLQLLMLDLQEAGSQPDVELLQDTKQLLARSESVLSQRPGTISSELRSYPIPGMLEILHRFRVDIRLDPTSAGAWATVSEDLKSVKAAEGWQGHTNHPGGGHFVFADQSFGTSGNHWYWEVDVTQLPQWTLGIHTTGLMDRNEEDSSAVLFLLSCVKKHEDYYLQSYPESLNHRVKDPVPRIGVFVEYCPGTVIFYNVLQRSLIYMFYPILFTDPITPIFCPSPPLPGTEPGAMTLCPVDSHLCACCYSAP